MSELQEIKDRMAARAPKRATSRDSEIDLRRVIALLEEGVWLHTNRNETTRRRANLDDEWDERARSWLIAVGFLNSPERAAPASST